MEKVRALPSVGFPTRSSSHVTECSIEKYRLKLHMHTNHKNLIPVMYISNYINNNHIK